LGFESNCHQKKPPSGGLFFGESSLSALGPWQAEQVLDIHGGCDERLLSAARTSSTHIAMCLVAINNFVISLTFILYAWFKNGYESVTK